ncbi:MAG: hypothetical protein KatS3mg083_508 [Candidatus Dojkabacteria bacterium]|nr:MAG: hypothetical protein KatS3mg083_508 [Candidatus Dojkabacteria bacterium]
MRWNEFVNMLEDAYKKLSPYERRLLDQAIILSYPIIERYKNFAVFNDKHVPMWQTLGIGSYSIYNILNYLSAYIRIALFKVFPSMRRKMLPELMFRTRCIYTPCKDQGECVLCGCLVPDKLFQNGSCYCYPKWGWFTKNIYKDIVLKQFAYDPEDDEEWEEDYVDDEGDRERHFITDRDPGDEHDFNHPNNISNLP